MKKYFSGMVALIIAIGFSAFTTSSHQQKKESDLYWISATDDSFYVLRDQSAEEGATGCNGSMADCAYGYTTQPTLVNGHYQGSGTPVVIKKVN